MSGGSWDYVSNKFEVVADRLKSELHPKRRVLGHLISKIAIALHDIEWVDSGDSRLGNEIAAIDAVINREDLIEEATLNAKAALQQLQEALAQP